MLLEVLTVRQTVKFYSYKCEVLAERVGFEPTIPCEMPLFESGAFNHSATSPLYRQYISV